MPLYYWAIIRSNNDIEYGTNIKKLLPLAKEIEERDFNFNAGWFDPNDDDASNDGGSDANKDKGDGAQKPPGVALIHDYYKEIHRKIAPLVVQEA